jgi:hypothetical protein
METGDPEVIPGKKSDFGGSEASSKVAAFSSPQTRFWPTVG